MFIVRNSRTVFSNNVFTVIVFSASVSTKSSSLQSPEIIFSAEFFEFVAELLFFYGWFIYAVVAELLPANLQKPSYKKCAFRVEKANTFQKTPKLAIVGCIHLSLFVTWYPYLDNLNFFSPDLSERENWTRREWRRRKEVTDSAETTPRNLMKLGDMEELSLEWCRKPVFLVFYVRNITHLCILYLTYAIFTQLSHVVYISQSCRLYNSAIPQTYSKIRKCLYNSAVSFR